MRGTLPGPGSGRPGRNRHLRAFPMQRPDLRQAHPGLSPGHRRRLRKMYVRRALRHEKAGKIKGKLAAPRQCAIHGGMRVVEDRRFRQLSAAWGRPVSTSHSLRAFQDGLEAVKLDELRQCAIHGGMRIVGIWRFRRLSAALGRPCMLAIQQYLLYYMIR